MKISFDFDGTIWDEFDRTPNNQKDEIGNICKSYIRNNHDVFIVTKRWGPNNRDKGLKNECDIVYHIGQSLGIKIENIIFTDREWKIDTLKKLNIDTHFENAEIEVKMIQETGIKVIPVEDPYWRDLIY